MSFINAMEGAALKQEREYDLSISQAWHSAQFSALAQVGKLKGLKTYLSKVASRAKSTASQALGFFHSLKARGLPIKIERVERSPVVDSTNDRAGSPKDDRRQA